MAVIGLDLGATKLAGALFDRDGTILERAVTLLEGREGDEVGRLIVERMSALRRVAAARAMEVEAVGVSVPGIAHHEDGTVWAPNIAGWERYPLRDMLRAEVGDSCQVVVENDRASSILAEVSRGVARGCRHAIFLAVGTGIGAGILVRRVDPEGCARHRGCDRMDGTRPPLPGGLPSLRRVRVARIRSGDRASGAGTA